MAVSDVGDLAPYDPAVTCPKCGHDDVSTFYQPGPHYPCVRYGEHLDRTCRRCQFGWPQAVIERDDDE